MKINNGDLKLRSSWSFALGAETFGKLQSPLGGSQIMIVLKRFEVNRRRIEEDVAAYSGLRLVVGQKYFY